MPRETRFAERGASELQAMESDQERELLAGARGRVQRAVAEISGMARPIGRLPLNFFFPPAPTVTFTCRGLQLAFLPERLLKLSTELSEEVSSVREEPEDDIESSLDSEERDSMFRFPWF